VARLEVFGIDGIPEVRPDDDLAGLIATAAAQGEDTALADGDVVVVTQKVVSKAENMLVQVDPDDPLSHKPLVEQESVRVLRRRGDLVISETRHGFICANAGIDLSNVDRGQAALLPRDSDKSARRIRDGLRAKAGVEVAVIVSDTFGRPWRRGLTDVAIGVSGIQAIVDLRGTEDSRGRVLQVTEVCVADELAGMADLVMGKATGVAAAVVRGVDPAWFGEGNVVRDVVRHPSEDLFRCRVRGRGGRRAQRGERVRPPQPRPRRARSLRAQRERGIEPCLGEHQPLPGSGAVPARSQRGAGVVGHLEKDRGPGAGAAVDLQRSTDELCTLLHADESELACLG
jgi:coenzyme F420-0:L-glutamate ligase / coenzyme F420-1:gamma-L-glutamate ligase